MMPTVTPPVTLAPPQASASPVGATPTAFVTTPVPATSQPTATPPEINQPSPSELNALPVNPLGEASSWSPDGQHLIIDTSYAGMNIVVDADGTVVGHVQANYATWLDSQTIAGEGDGTIKPGPDSVTLYDAGGNEIGSIPGEYEGVMFAPGHRIGAASPEPKDGQEEATSYKIWNGSTLSDWLPGIPMKWSPDGTRLAVLTPNDEPSPGIGTYGTVTIVDAMGSEVTEIKGRVGSTFEPVAFSPDDRYLATCLVDQSGESEAINVLDTQTGSLSDVATDQNGTCGFYVEWSSEPRLYVFDGDQAPVVWTPSSGIVDAGLAEATLVEVAPNGYFANWSAYDSQVRVVQGDTETSYQLPDTPNGMIWSPDGSRLAVNVDEGVAFLTPGSTPPIAEPSPGEPVAIDATQARFIALGFFYDPKTHGEYTDIDGAQITSLTFDAGTETGVPAWIIEISATTSGPAKGQTGTSNMTLSVDASHGRVRILASS